MSAGAKVVSWIDQNAAPTTVSTSGARPASRHFAITRSDAGDGPRSASGTTSIQSIRSSGASAAPDRSRASSAAAISGASS